MSLIEIGTLGRPHGVQGEITLHPCTLTTQELLVLKTFTLHAQDGAERTLTLATARRANEKMLVRFTESSVREDAAGLSRGRLLVERERLPDPGPQATYNFQLVGLDVVTQEGRAVGQVAEIWPTPAHPVLVVRGPGEVLIPAIAEFVLAVDLTARRITVRLLPGMEPTAGE